MILRPTYIAQLTPFIDKPQIKIITGIRRSGKSTVLHLLKEELSVKGIKKEQLISINFESFAYTELLKAANLYQYIKDNIKTTGKYYLLLDEIQEVEVVTMDDFWRDAIEGVKHLYIRDFLLKENL